MQPSILSGEDVARAGLSRRQASLADRGEKLSERDLELMDRLTFEQRLAARYNDIKQLIQRPHAAKRSDVCYADWLDDVALARAVSVPAKFWLYMGAEVAGVKYLHREEALLLCDMGYMVLREDGHALSMQQAYGRLFRHCSCLLRHYRVYAHLTRQGHRIRVRRNVAVKKIHSHSPETPITAYEKKIRLDQYLVAGKTDELQASSCRSSSSQSNGNSSAPNSIEVVECSPTPLSIPTPADCCMTSVTTALPGSPTSGEVLTVDSKTYSHANQCFPSNLIENGSEVHVGDELNNADVVFPTLGRCESPDPFSDWSLEHGLARDDRGRLSRQFLASYGLAPAVTPPDSNRKINSPPSHLLPSGVVPNSCYFLDSSKGGATVAGRSYAAIHKFISHLPRASDGARNWRMYKQEIRELYRGNSDLYRNKRLADVYGHSPALLMRRLRVAPSVSIVRTSWQTWLRRRVIYDVYTPQQHFRKSRPPPPSSRLAVISVDTELGEGADEPDGGLCDCLRGQWCPSPPLLPPDDDVPLRVAVVPETAEPAIYTLTFGSLAENRAITGWEHALLRCCGNIQCLST